MGRAREDRTKGKSGGLTTAERDEHRLRSHPLVPGYVSLHGYLYDVATGRLREVPAGAGQPADLIAGGPSPAERSMSVGFSYALWHFYEKRASGRRRVGRPAAARRWC